MPQKETLEKIAALAKEIIEFDKRLEREEKELQENPHPDMGSTLSNMSGQRYGMIQSLKQLLLNL